LSPSALTPASYSYFRMPSCLRPRTGISAGAKRRRPGYDLKTPSRVVIRFAMVAPEFKAPSM
jgi:hypothetical protein